MKILAAPTLDRVANESLPQTTVEFQSQPQDEVQHDPVNPVETVNRQSFKLVMLWTAYTSRVIGRMCQDLLAIQRLAVTSRADFEVACDPQFYPKLRSLGIKVADTFLHPSLTRVYIHEGEELPPDLAARIDYAAEVDLVNLRRVLDAPPADGKGGDYPGFKLPQQWYRIPPTLKLGKPAPKGLDGLDPMWNPFR